MTWTDVDTNVFVYLVTLERRNAYLYRTVHLGHVQETWVRSLESIEKFSHTLIFRLNEATNHFSELKSINRHNVTIRCSNGNPWCGQKVWTTRNRAMQSALNHCSLVHLIVPTSGTPAQATFIPFRVNERPNKPYNFEALCATQAFSSNHPFRTTKPQITRHLHYLVGDLCQTRLQFPRCSINTTTLKVQFMADAHQSQACGVNTHQFAKNSTIAYGVGCNASVRLKDRWSSSTAASVGSAMIILREWKPAAAGSSSSSSSVSTAGAASEIRDSRHIAP